MASDRRAIKVLLTKTSLDGHWRGVAIVATAFRDAGMEVIYGGALTPEEIVAAAVQEDADVIGLNIGGRYGVVERLMKMLRERGVHDKLVVAGGTIPDDDVPFLKGLGIAEVFPPGSPTARIVDFVQEHAPRAALR